MKGKMQNLNTRESNGRASGERRAARAEAPESGARPSALDPRRWSRPVSFFSFFVFNFGLIAAATTNSPAAKPVAESAGSESLSPAVLPPPPQSVFVLPKKATQGKDPFFPNATRVYNSETAVRPKGPEVSVGDLSLRGISGTTAEPLAIINTTTFTTGEENEVITAAGRMRVRCVAINMVLGTALVQVGGERRELRLPPQK